MFFSKGNNNNNGVNVNTSFYTSYSDTFLLTVGGWNRQLSVKLQPCTGKDANGVNQYSNELSTQISTSITQDNALVLLEGWKTVLKPALDKKEESKISISMGNNDNKKVLSLLYDGTDAYLELAVNIDENGVTDKILKHKFNKKSYMTSYDASSGNGEEVTVESDLLNFIEKLKATQNLIPTVAHSINYSNATKNAFKNNNNQNNNAGNNYSAPTSNSGEGMDFLPFN